MEGNVQFRKTDEPLADRPGKIGPDRDFKAAIAEVRNQARDADVVGDDVFAVK